MSTLLITGGAGYIGSHTIVELLQAGHEVVCIDNYVNSSPEALRRVERIAERRVTQVEGDVRDAAALGRIFAQHAIDGVIHFAALKAVGESVARPLAYYDNNVGGALALLAAMDRAGVRRMVFSSSATVYGVPRELPLREDAPLAATNPYGQTKVIVEQMLRDLAAADSCWSIVSLRYFNPIGAHPSGLIGEDPHDIPNNLFPFITQVAAGKRERLNVFGKDWPTPDGTGVRDYLHVVDLAAGHLRAFEYAGTRTGCIEINLGTGRGTSVLELVQAFEQATGRRVPCAIAPRRPGDIAACWADPSRAHELLGWRAERSIAQACADGWRWQQNNPNGYRDEPGRAS
jgi:UDP-glucose 4-epimerase